MMREKVGARKGLYAPLSSQLSSMESISDTAGAFVEYAISYANNEISTATMDTTKAATASKAFRRILLPSTLLILARYCIICTIENAIEERLITTIDAAKATATKKGSTLVLLHSEALSGCHHVSICCHRVNHLTILAVLTEFCLQILHFGCLGSANMLTDQQNYVSSYLREKIRC
jgi:hypothetical protein